MNEQIDELLAKCDPKSGFQKSELRTILRHLLDDLERCIGMRVVVPTEGKWTLDQYIEHQICLDLASAEPFGGFLGLTWRGDLTFVYDTNLQRVRFVASVFLHSHGRRVVLESGPSFLDLEYVFHEHQWEWKSLGWQVDEYGEYEGW